MKFSDGAWLVKQGYRINSPAQIYETTQSKDTATIIAPCKRINNKGNTLSGAVITIEISSPAPNVIHVRAFHHKGVVDKGPHFDIKSTPEWQPQIVENDSELLVVAGNLSARVTKSGNWALEFLRGNEKITSSDANSMAYIEQDNGNVYFKDELSLTVNESVYGLGERFTSYAKNGQTVDIWNADGGTYTEQAYKNIPFYVTSRGYGVFVNHPEQVSFEVASEHVWGVQFSVAGEAIDYYVIDGPSIKDVITRYTGMTGRPSLPPAWSFGLWLSTSFLTDYNEDTVSSFIEGMAERDIPLSVFHFDCCWMKEYNWCDFTWDNRIFPDPNGMLSRLKDRGLKICVWINPYISQQSCLFDEAAQNGYLIRRKDGSVWQWDLWQPGMGIVDFTNPDACLWFSKQLEKLMDMGVNCFKTDFGERIPSDGVIYHDGSDPLKMHNYYTYLYNRTVFETIGKHRGSKNAIVFARSATVGSQQFAVHWGGDCKSDFRAMAETLRGGLSFCTSGFSFWSHDIGGFENTATADVYKRWLAFGLLSSHSRLHGNHSYRVPWAYDEEAVDVARFFVKLKCSFMPYIYKTACEAALTGLPVMRAMPLEFQDDPACLTLERQYMLGDSLLVAPIFSETGDVSYYLPEGRWINYVTGAVLDGGRWMKENHGYLSLPLLLRPGRILAVGSCDNRPDYDYTDNVTFLLTSIADGQSITTDVYDAEGSRKEQATAYRNGNKISFHVKGAEKPWKLRLSKLFDCEFSVEGGHSANDDKNGITILPDSISGEMIIIL